MRRVSLMLSLRILALDSFSGTMRKHGPEPVGTRSLKVFRSVPARVLVSGVGDIGNNSEEIEAPSVGIASSAQRGPDPGEDSYRRSALP